MGPAVRCSARSNEAAGNSVQSVGSAWISETVVIASRVSSTDVPEKG